MNELEKLYFVRKHLFEMLIDRNYNIHSFFLNETFEQFQKWIGYTPQRNKLTCFTKHNESNESIIIFFPEESKVGIETIRSLGIF